MIGFVPSGLGFRSNGTLIISMPWIIVKSLGSSFNDLLKTIKTIFNNITVSFLGLKDHPPFQKLDFGLFSAVFLSPRSNFQTAQRFPTPNHVTSGCLSPRSLFPPGQRFLLPNHVTSGLGDVTSGSGHVTSGHVTSGGEPAILPHGPRF